MRMLIRKASQNDLGLILDFARQMSEMHKQLDAYYKLPTNLEETLSSDLNDENSLTLIAEENGISIGYIRVSIERAPAYITPKKIGVVYDLFVNENHRLKGVGKKLFDEALEWLRNKNIKHIELSVDARNISGIAAWKKFGFLEYKIRMRKDI